MRISGSKMANQAVKSLPAVAGCSFFAPFIAGVKFHEEAA